MNKSRLLGSEIEGGLFNATASPGVFQNAAGVFQNAAPVFQNAAPVFQNAGWGPPFWLGNVDFTKGFQGFSCLGHAFHHLSLQIYCFSLGF